MIKTKNIKTFDYGQQLSFKISGATPGTRNVGGSSKAVLDLDVMLTDHQGVEIEPRVTLFVDYEPTAPFVQFVTAFIAAHPECVSDDADGTLDEHSFVGKSGVAKGWNRNGYVRLSDVQFSQPAPDFTQLDNGGLN